MRVVLSVLVGSIVLLASCSNKHDTVRAKDVLTGVVAPIKADTRIYQSGDTVWINYLHMTTTTLTHMEVEHPNYRLFVIE